MVRREKKRHVVNWCHQTTGCQPAYVKLFKPECCSIPMVFVGTVHEHSHSHTYDREHLHRSMDLVLCHLICIGKTTLLHLGRFDNALHHQVAKIFSRRFFDDTT